MNVHRHLRLGTLLVFVAACSDEPNTAGTRGTDPQLSKLVSVRVAGFVEAAGIT